MTDAMSGQMLDFFATHENASTRRPGVAADHVEESRLAGTVRTRDTECLTFMDLKRQVVDCG
jgi:hypothetical protein